MLREMGCVQVRSVLFDYNLLQFPELSRDHVDALLRLTVESDLADTILAIGRVR
jgi:hypothetical protein